MIESPSERALRRPTVAVGKAVRGRAVPGTTEIAVCSSAGARLGRADGERVLSSRALTLA